MIDNFFDKYTFQARLSPALLTLFPVFLTIAVWTPGLYKFATGLISLAVASGITTVLAHFSRTLGVAVQEKLIKEWGALPATLWLRRDDENLDLPTKQRYYKFLENNIDGWKAPSAKDEREKPKETLELYESAIIWLREFSRDTQKFPLLFRENISYGFRRNTLGLKPIGISLAVFCSIFGFWQLWGVRFDIIISSYTPHAAALFVSALLSIWWLFGVNKKWVKGASIAYARALLANCDIPKGVVQ